jgi:hypothetical protein
MVIIIKALNLDPSESLSKQFLDSNTIPVWAKGYIQTAIDEGFVSGYPDNTFKGLKPCTRAELFTMIMKAFGYGEAEKIPDYSDANKVPAWAIKYISKAVEMGIVKGYSDNTIKPENNVTRAEVFTIIEKCLKITDFKP